jgi:hypothetical protein
VHDLDAAGRAPRLEAAFGAGEGGQARRRGRGPSASAAFSTLQAPGIASATSPVFQPGPRSRKRKRPRDSPASSISISRPRRQTGAAQALSTAAGTSRPTTSSPSGCTRSAKRAKASSSAARDP